MKFLRDLIDLVTTIPFAHIAANVLRGNFGWRASIAMVLQVALQIWCAYGLGLGVTGTVTVAALLIGIHLFMGMLVALMPLDGMSPNPSIKSFGQYVAAASTYSLVFSGVATAVVVGVAMVWATGPFLSTFATSVLGATVLHLWGVVYPIYLSRTGSDSENGND